MDFHNMKRKELQALCKKHNIPANLSNSQMALNLSSLLQEKEKPTKGGQGSSKASTVTVAEKDSSTTTRQSKKVRFSPTDETFEYLELRSGRKEKTKVTQAKSSMKPAASKGGKPVEKVDNNLNKEVTGKMIRSLRSRVQATVEGCIIPVINSPLGIKRGRRVGKDADNADSTEEVVIKSVRVTRSRGQTSSEDGSVPVLEQRVGKKRGRGRAVENKDGGKSMEDIVSIPVRTTRSRAQTSKESGVSTMPNLLIEKKRARKRSKVGDETVQSTVEVTDSSDNVASQKAASDQAKDLPSKRSLRKRELGDADIKGNENMRQKNQNHETAKGIRNVSEDEPLAKNAGVKEPELCLRQSTRNGVPVRDTTISKRKFGETEMVGRGKITRSRNQLAKQDNNNNKTEAAIVVQRKTEVVPPAESLRRTGRNANQKKSVMPQEAGNVVESPGDSEVVPLSEEPERRSARKASKRISIMPKTDEVKAAEPRSEKGEILKENKTVVSHTGPLRRSHRQTSLLEPIAPTDADLASPVVGVRKRSDKQSYAVSCGNAVATAARNSTPNKQRGDLNIDEPVVDIQDAHSAEESSRRFTGSATKGVGSPVTSSLEKIAGKKKQQRTVIPTSSGASAMKEKSSAEAQVSMQEVAEISTDLISGSKPVNEDNGSKKRSERQSTRSSKQEGFKENFAKHLEQAKRQTSVSKSKKFQIDGAENEKDISVRKRRGDHLSNEDCLEISPKRLTRSPNKSVKITEWNLPQNSARQKMPQSRSRPPKLVQDGDSKGKNKPSIDAKFAMPELLRSPTDLYSGSTGVVKVRSSETSTKSSRSTRSSKKGELQEVHAEASNVDEVKGQLSSSISRKLLTDYRQIHKGISSRKERGEITFEAEDVKMNCIPPAEESSRRLTRSAFKCYSNTANNLTGESVDKKKLKNRSKTHMQEVKAPSSDRISAIHGGANISDAQFSLPEAIKSANGPAREVICGTSTKMRNTVSSSACALNGDGTEEVCAQTSNITKGKDQASNLEETSASESERLQTDDIEMETVVSINETAIITETAITIGDGPMHAINGMATSTAFSNLGLPNLEKEIALEEGTSTYSIDIMPEVLASAIERSIEIENTSGQESARPFTGTAGMNQSESKHFEIEVPLEEGISALEGVLNIAAVPEVSGEAIRPVLSSSGIFEHNSSSHKKNSSTGSHVNGEGSSDEVYAETLGLDETKGQDQKETEMDNSVDEAVDVAENVNIVLGDDKEKSRRCSDEMFNEAGPGSHSLEVMKDLSVTADNGFDRTTSTAIGCLPAEQSHSLSKAQEMLDSTTYDQPSPAASDVLVRDDGVDSLKDQISVDCNRLSTETVGDTFLEDDLHAYNQSGGSRENDGDISQDAGTAEDGSNLFKERNHDEEETENNMEFVKPHEFGSAPARQSKELEISYATSSFAVEELPLQLPEVIESENTQLRSSKEPLESFDGMVGVSATTSFSEKQKSCVKVCTGPALNENVDLVAMNLEKAHDLNLQKLQSEPKMVELDLALEENSVDHNRNSDYAEIVKSPICGAVIPETNGSDDLGFENKMELSAAKDDFTSCHDEQKFVESSVLDDDAQGKGGVNTPNSVREISRSLSFNQEKNRGEILDMNDYDGKASDLGAHMDDAVTGSVCIANATIDKNISQSLPTHDNCELGTTSKKVVGHSFELQESNDTVPAEESQHEECATKENQPQVTCEEMTGIHSESDQGYQLQKIFETPVSKDVQESKDTVQLEESQHEDFPCNDNKLQNEEDYEHQNLFETPASKSENRAPEEECQPENDPSTENQMQSEPGEGNARPSSGEDIDYEDLWHEDTLPTLFATPASRSISSKDASSYCDEKMADIAFFDSKTQEIRSVESPSNCFESISQNDIVSKCDAFTTLSSNTDGEEQDINVSGGSHSMDVGGSDMKDPILKEKVGTVKDFSDGLPSSNNAIIEEDSCNRSTGCQTSLEYLYGVEVISPDHAAETNWPSCNLMDANHTGEDRQQETKREISSSVSAEEQPPVEPDRTIHEDEELFEGFDAAGETEQYFHSEQTENADYENFGGITQDLFTEAAEMSGHDYTSFDEPGVKDEVNNIVAKNNAGVEDDEPMSGWNVEEKEKMQLEKAPSDKLARIEAPSDMSSRTNPSSVFDDFATDEGK